MNPLDDLLDADGPPTDDGIGLMTELVAAVTWPRRGAMPDLTIWDAITETSRIRLGLKVDWAEPDSLRATLKVAVVAHDGPTATLLAPAIHAWLAATSESLNEGIRW